MCSYSWRVPLHAFGELKIVASCDIGELGPTEGTVQIYNWNPLYNVIGLLPWLLLVLSILILPENRCGQILWILLPLVILRLLWMAFVKMMGAPSEFSSLFIPIIDCLVIGLSINWLMAERIGKRNRFITWLLAISIFLLVIGAGMVSIGFGQEAVQVLFFNAMTVGILMVSFAMAGFMCRKKFGPVLFSLWMAVWIMLSTLVFFLLLGVIQSIMINYSMVRILLQVLMVSLIYGGILIVGLLPFEILLFKNTFWRKRFEAVFGLKAARTLPESIPTDPLAESEISTSE